MAGEPTTGRVLIVDDEPHVREMLRDFLIGQGYEVVAAGTGAQAVTRPPSRWSSRKPGSAADRARACRQRKAAKMIGANDALLLSAA